MLIDINFKNVHYQRRIDHPKISEQLFFYADVSGLFLYVTRLMWVRHLVRMPLEHLRSSMRPIIFISVR